MSQLQRKVLFPTPVYFKDIPNAKNLNKYLFKHIKAWRKAEPKGEIKTNSGFGWHSPTDMNQRKEFDPLTSELFKMAEECNKDYGVKPKLGLGNMWANVSPTYSYNKTHTHPNSLWSGVYYVKVPKNSGKLFLEDPRPGPNTYMPRRADNIPEALWRVCAYDAIEGRMIFFPSWLPHGVDLNMNTEKGEKNWRISVSYNFIQT
jgi:uncharacterized protein (TIGR02466 family)